MNWRLAAAWALLGFSSQCLVAVMSGLDLVTGLGKAMIHYVAWGLAGWMAGLLIKRTVEDSFRSRVLQMHTDDLAPSPAGRERSP